MKIISKRKGYEILDQNCKTKYGETDIIAHCGKELVFVEVGTKIGENFGTPEDSLDKRKLRKIWLNARAGKATRIDAVCIVLNNNLTVERLNHYENIV
ncbi:MAG: YraN family protein [Candidatus Nealsonbacteria bacterium]|nr:YraN family protein [Candidatus Nealsonbacteria bacterium]